MILFKLGRLFYSICSSRSLVSYLIFKILALSYDHVLNAWKRQCDLDQNVDKCLIRQCSPQSAWFICWCGCGFKIGLACDLGIFLFFPLLHNHKLNLKKVLDKEINFKVFKHLFYLSSLVISAGSHINFRSLTMKLVILQSFWKHLSKSCNLLLWFKILEKEYSYLPKRWHHK